MFRFCVQSDGGTLTVLKHEETEEAAKKWWEQSPALYTFNRFCAEQIGPSDTVVRRWWLQFHSKHGFMQLVWKEEPNPMPRNTNLA